MPDTNVDIACQREIRRPIEKIKKDRKIPRTIKNDENAKRKLDVHFIVSGCVSFARVRRRAVIFRCEIRKSQPDQTLTIISKACR